MGTLFLYIAKKVMKIRLSIESYNKKLIYFLMIALLRIAIAISYEGHTSTVLIMFIFLLYKKLACQAFALQMTGGEEGIRTLAPPFESSHLAGEHF